MKRWQKVLTLIGVFAAGELIYQLLLYLERTYFPLYPVCIMALGVIISVMLCAIIILNGGFDKKNAKPEDYPQSYSLKEREEMAEKRNKMKKTARILMLIFIPLAVIFSLDLLDTFYGITDSFKGMFK